MSRKLSILGFVLTAAYVWLLYFIFDGRIVESLSMKPNEIGDLLAGMFGPLAILWLILGFFQQGTELRQNTAALKLQEEALKAQVTELNRSVEQQRELVRISQTQLHNELEKTRQEKSDRVEAVQPRIAINAENISGHGNGHAVHAEIINVGMLATDIEFTSSPEIFDLLPKSISSLLPNKAQKLYWRQTKIAGSDTFFISVSFTDILGNRGTQSFRIVAGHEHEQYAPIKIIPAILTDC